MSPSDASKVAPVPAPVPAPNPIHVVGNLSAKDLVAARYDGLRPFHLGLDQAERNLRGLLPASHLARASNTAGRAKVGFLVTDESRSYEAAQADPYGSSGPAPSVPFELWSPWVTDVDAADLAQPV